MFYDEGVLKLIALKLGHVDDVLVDDNAAIILNGLQDVVDLILGEVELGMLGGAILDQSRDASDHIIAGLGELFFQLKLKNLTKNQ